MNYITSINHRGRVALAVALLLVCMAQVVSTSKAADTAVQLSPVIPSQPSSVPAGTPTRHTFYANTVTYNYPGTGSVVLSTSTDGTASNVVDDGLKLIVTRPDGTLWEREYDYYTQDQPSTDITEAFKAGNNTVRIELLDLIGPVYGSPRPFYLVSFSGPPAQPAGCPSAQNGFDPCLQHKLQKGDILMMDPARKLNSVIAGFVGTYWFHVGLYDGAGNVLEAVGLNPADRSKEVKSTPIRETGFYKDANDWIVLRVKPEHQSKVDGAVAWAQAKAEGTNAVYMPPGEWLNPGNKAQDAKFYCSLFVWRAYKEQGLDLDQDYGIFKLLQRRADLAFGLLTQVVPDDLYASAVLGSRPTTIVYDEKRNAFRTLFILLSPADLRVADATGNVSGVDPQTGGSVEGISGSFYSGPASEPEWIGAPSMSYPARVEVSGTGTGIYSLGVQALGDESVQSQAFQWDTQPGQVDIYQVTDPGTGVMQLQPVLLTVRVDIKPGDAPNSINPASKGVVPLAILSTRLFDAASVDPLSVRFGPSAASEAHGRGHMEDVNGDGTLDMVLHFRPEQSGITHGDTEACIIGRMSGGINIRGCDTIRTVPHGR